MTIFGGGGIGGVSAKGWFGAAPGWVDTAKPAGATSQEASGFGSPGWWTGYVRLSVLLPFTPNLVWLAMTAAAYFGLPYDMEAAAQWRGSFFVTRAAVNLALTYAYYGFFHWALYNKSWSKRKFDGTNSGPTLARMLHNVWYCTLGALQWTAWEVCFVHMYSTKKLAYVEDGAAFGTPSGLAYTILLVLAVPVLREVHFYFCHRMIHYRALYRYVHSLHHRNTDPEPFSGISMHPIEHLYYFACVALVLYVPPCSPFIMTWLGLHALISPACPHSGFEDHWHSDQFHYIHHARFDKNFGIPAIPFDKWFGTYREAAELSQAASPDKVKRTYLSGGLNPLWALPASWDVGAYIVSCCAIFGTVTWAAVNDVQHPALAPLLALGPVLAAQLLCVLSGDKMAWNWPFKAEKAAGGLGIHLACGVALCVVPVWHTAALALSPAHGGVTE